MKVLTNMGLIHRRNISPFFILKKFLLILKMKRDIKGRFLKNSIPWNTGKGLQLDLKEINNLHCNKEKSILDISKDLGVSDGLIRIRLKEGGYKIRKKINPTKITKEKIRLTLIKKGIKPTIRYSGEVWNKGLTDKDPRVKNNIRGLLENRKNQIFPLKNTKIENKIKRFLDLSKIEYTQHKLLTEIKHFYQCDFYIPKQKGINKITILECDGCYWHGCNLCMKELNKNQIKQKAKDNKRNKELKGKNYKVIRLWEHEIKKLNLLEFKRRFINLNDI